MKLYHLYPKKHSLWKPWYDKTFAVVVRAENETQARRLASKEGGYETEGAVGGNPNAWLSSELTHCEELIAEGNADIIIVDHRSA